MDTTDEALAVRFAREWVGDATLTPLGAMNSSTWAVDAGDERSILKIASPSDEPGLHVASCLESRGIQTGAPLRLARHAGRLVALLRFVDGVQLTAADAPLVGATLGGVHVALRDCPAPDAIDAWPWDWLDPALVAEPALRAATRAAVDRAVVLAPSLTHGLLHGDPAPEAFLATAEGVALIDWGAGGHGPLLYDVASAVMYAGRGVIPAYEAAGPLGAAELAHLEVFSAFRWAVQAWYFSKRLASGDLTGIEDESDNEDGLSDARRGLLG